MLECVCVCVCVCVGSVELWAQTVCVLITKYLEYVYRKGRKFLIF